MFDLNLVLNVTFFFKTEEVYKFIYRGPSSGVKLHYHAHPIHPCSYAAVDAAVDRSVKFSSVP
jgi:hypothetical protein